MFLALKLLGLGEGDEVISSPNTFTSSINVIFHAGAKPVLADIEMETYGLDPDSVEAAIGPKTRAILAVHYGGQACRIRELKEIADRHGLFLIEDLAHGFGARLEGRHLGHHGDFAAFSFYATKNLNTGEGGFLACNSEEREKEASLMGFHGMDRDAWKRYGDRGSWFYEISRVGYKFNMSDPQAALGVVQLERADELLLERSRIAGRYLEAFAREPALILPQTGADALHSWHLFVPRLVPGSLRIERDDFLKALIAEGISPSLHFIPIHHHPAHKDSFAGLALPSSEAFYETCFTLPLFAGMEEREIDEVIEAVQKLLNYYRS
jgi:dTDP-4-amino-4,6-dideoxygalactose transaminase